MPDGAGTEDGIIAYTWNHFVLKDTSSPEWLLRLPMTKAVSKAMDTITAFTLQHLDHVVTGFVVGGESKRGWTTWTTGAIEPRCVAVSGIAIAMVALP